MINLEMLFWAAKNGGNPYLADIAVSHADKTMKYHFRPDRNRTNQLTKLSRTTRCCRVVQLNDLGRTTHEYELYDCLTPSLPPGRVGVLLLQILLPL